MILKVRVHFSIFYLKNLKQFVNDLLSFKLFRIVTFMFLKNYPQNLLKETKKLLIKFYDAIAAILPPNYSSRLKLGKIDCCDVHEKKKISPEERKIPSKIFIYSQLWLPTTPTSNTSLHALTVSLSLFHSLQGGRDFFLCCVLLVWCKFKCCWPLFWFSPFLLKVGEWIGEENSNNVRKCTGSL